MSRPSKIKYDPKLSVEENAKKNNVSVSGIYYYLRTQNVDCFQQRASGIVSELKKAIKENPEASQAKIAEITGRSITTVNKYWKVATGEKKLVSTKEARAEARANTVEHQTISRIAPRVFDDILKAEPFSENVRLTFDASTILAGCISVGGHNIIASIEKKADVLGCPTILDFTVENLKRLMKESCEKVALLLPLSVLSDTGKYTKVFKAFPPSKVYAYTSSIGEGSDVLGYAWYVWNKKAQSETAFGWIGNVTKKGKTKIEASTAGPRCLLFDFDNTLVNSDSRRDNSGHWLSGFPDECIEGYKLYDGWKAVLKWAEDKGIKTAIISTTPKDHIEKALSHLGIQVDAIYGQVKKNSGKMLISAINDFCGKPEDALYVGDNRKDADIARMANVHFAAAVWDSWHEARLARRNCLAVKSPVDIIPLFDNLSEVPIPIKVDKSTDPNCSLPQARKSILEALGTGFAQSSTHFLKVLSAKDSKGQTELVPNDPPRNNTEPRVYGIMGAVIGDIIGSRFEFLKAFPKYDFKLFGSANLYTDDTIMTVAIADALLHQKGFQEAMLEWGHKYPNGGWGGNFRKWLKSDNPQPYNSKGNGCGMRISPVGFYGNTLEEVLDLATKATVPTHGSEEGLNGAKAIASAIFLARQHKPKAEIKKYIEENFGYNLNATKDDIVNMVKHFEKGMGELAEYSVPVAIIAFLNGSDFEDTMRIAMTYGGDADTIGAMLGGISAAYYGVPMSIAQEAVKYLSQDILAIINEFDKTSFVSPRITPSVTHEWNNDCVIVYGKSVNEGENGEDGSYDVHNIKNHHKVEGYAIRTIGADFEDTEQDVKAFVQYVDEHPQKTFLVKRVGIQKANIPVDKMAPLFEPLKDKTNVFLPIAFREYLDKSN